MIKVTLAIPCYNCSAQIGRVLTELDEDLIRGLQSIIVIDNRSSDNTRAQASTVAALINAKHGNQKISVVTNRMNYGLGGSHKVAFLAARAAGSDYLAILHGDNQAVSSELRLLVNAARKDPSAAAILGARFHWRSSLQGYSAIRTVGNVGLNLLYSLFTLRPILDLGSGINLFKVSHFEDLHILRFDDGFTFNMDLLLDYIKKGCRLVYVPITWRETDQVSNAKAVQVGWKTLKKLFAWRFGFGPDFTQPPKEYLTD